MELYDKIRLRKEQEKCNEFKGVQLIKSEGGSAFRGRTKLGKEVKFIGISYGMTSQGLYGAGTLKVLDNGNWVTIFTKGYPSRALKWMTEN